jgi:hypothetical protein
LLNVADFQARVNALPGCASCAHEHWEAREVGKGGITGTDINAVASARLMKRSGCIMPNCTDEPCEKGALL